MARASAQLSKVENRIPLLPIGVDINGLPHAVHVTTANVTDRDGALEMFEIYAPHLTSVVKALEPV